MKEISIQELHNDTDQGVRLAATRERIIITDGGQPIAALTPIEPSPKRLPDREEKINRRSRIETDSADYVSEMRG
ncbi:MAG TPA: type II toxin-antitoxin system prevent-host-death family antitoxin [Blastocatellia bacterium]|jgi:prevent-host-death family protein